MEMEARRAFAAAQQEVWDTLHDPQVLRACLAGCEKFDAVVPGHHRVDWVLKLGAGTVRFDGNVYLMESVPPERYRVDFDGDGGVAGGGTGTARARLIALPDHAPGHPRCQLHYNVNTTLTGNITKVDKRLVDIAVQGLTEQFFRRFDEQLRRRYPRVSPESVESAASYSDSDDQERGGAPTMLLERPVALPPAPSPAVVPTARPVSGWALTAGIACVLVAAAIWWYVMR